VRFRVLGPVEIEVDDRILTLPRRRERSLLGLLLLELDRVVPVDRLAELLWDGEPPERARRTIHGHVWRIRRRLAEAGAAAHAYELITVGDGYRLSAAPEAVDAHRFRALVDAAATLPDPAARIDLLRSGLALWRGPVLAQAASDWLRSRLGADLEERRLAAVEDLMADSLALRRERTVLPSLAEIAASHPGRERLIDLYMQALHRVGRKAEALAVYDRTRAFLTDELGIDPGPALRERHRAILRDEPAPEPPPVDPVHPIVPRQLPAAVAHFVGRAGELAGLRPDRLTDPDRPSPVVVIDGTAGVGKTTLAVHIAHQIADAYPDGQLYIDLHAYTVGIAPIDPGHALERMLRALGVPGSQIPVGVDERAGLYRSRLAGQRILIVLDNAASERQVQPLLPGAPGCLVLVTSRRRLAGLDHAHALSLDLLPLPDAVSLLAQATRRDRLAEQDPTQLAEIVQLCGRLPLAISIAAARLRSHATWEAKHLAERLRDQLHRLSELAAGQRSVTAALDLSYEQLPVDQRRMYRMLGLHPGADFDGYAAAALADTGLAEANRLVDQLVETNLLQEPEPGRYRFHDLTRVHAGGTALTVDPEPARRAALHRLLDHYRHTASVAMDVAHPYERGRRPLVPRAATATPDLPDPARAAEWLDTALPNLLVVARYAGDHGWPEHSWHLSATLYRHMRTRSSYQAAGTLYGRALSVAQDAPAEVDALIGLGWVHRMQGRHGEATADYERALAITRAMGDGARESEAHCGLGEIHLTQSRYDEASEHFQRAQETGARAGHRSVELSALTWLGHTCWLRSRFAEALDQLARALKIARSIGYRSGEVNALNGLGHTHWQQGDDQRAAHYYREALEIARATGDRAGVQDSLAGLGRAHRRTGRFAEAVDCYQQALALARTTGNRNAQLGGLTGLGAVHRRLGQSDRAADDYRELLDIAEETGNRNGQYEALYGLGRVHQATGEAEIALTYHERALALATDLSQPTDQARALDGMAYALAHLGQRAAARHHWQRALDLLAGIGTDYTDDDQVSAVTIGANLTASR
jgi:DNA-binding SARP family transcriptional activator/tetratricopeptide (TPR) repeat protein